MLRSYKIISVVLISQFVIRLGVTNIGLNNCIMKCCQKEQTSCCGENEKNQCPMGMIDCNESFFPTLFYNSHSTADHKQDLKTNIQELISLAKSDGVIPVLINFPSPQYENAPLEAKEFSNKDLNMQGRWDGFQTALRFIRKNLKWLADKNKISLIDVNARFEKENHNFVKKFSYFIDRMHSTPEGNTIIAETMAPAIKDILATRNQ